jgi:predicted nuclease of predicted toxin-antitoxin system
MKIKRDENIGRRGIDLLRAAGHDVMTVRDQDMQGAADEILFGVCANEGRVLITLDHDPVRFSDFLRREALA